MMSVSLIVQHLLFMNPTIGLEYTLVTPHCYAFDSTSMVRPCNRVAHTGMPTADEVEQIKQFFGSKPFSWAVEEEDTQVRELLEKQDLTSRFSFAAMSLSLHQFAQPELPLDIVIEQIDLRDEQALATFAKLMQPIFTTDAAEIEKVVRLLAQHTTNNALRMYFGYYKGELAAIGMSVHHESIATLHWIGTLPEFRGKGLATALIVQALFDLRNAGCQQACLLASDAGKTLYERLGFKVYARYFMYGNY